MSGQENREGAGQPLQDTAVHQTDTSSILAARVHSSAPIYAMLTSQEHCKASNEVKGRISN